MRNAEFESFVQALNRHPVEIPASSHWETLPLSVRQRPFVLRMSVASLFNYGYNLNRLDYLQIYGGGRGRVAFKTPHQVFAVSYQIFLNSNDRPPMAKPVINPTTGAVRSTKYLG